jgi:sarcosine oxidase subunit gamma
MLEHRSALAAARPYTSSVLKIAELPGFTLTQVAGLAPDFEARLGAVFGDLPSTVGKTVEAGGHTLMRIGPVQFWIIGAGNDDAATRLQGVGAVTPLSHSRSRIVIEGAPVRDVLAKGIPLDFHASAFIPGMFAMTGLHHTPVLVHCVSPDRFELYVLRTFAMSVWEWLADAALEYAN